MDISKKVEEKLQQYRFEGYSSSLLLSSRDFFLNPSNPVSLEEEMVTISTISNYHWGCDGKVSLMRFFCHKVDKHLPTSPRNRILYYLQNGLPGMAKCQLSTSIFAGNISTELMLYSSHFTIVCVSLVQNPLVIFLLVMLSKFNLQICTILYSCNQLLFTK